MEEGPNGKANASEGDRERELKGNACPIGGTFFDELCLLIIALFGGLKPTLHYYITVELWEAEDGWN